MENFSYHVPFYVVTGGIMTQGHSSDLTAGQIALIDRATWSVATNAGSGREFFFAQGAFGGLAWDLSQLTESHKSPFFLGRDVENLYVSLPARLQNEEWVLGFNGSTSSKSLTYEVGKPMRFKFLFSGQPTYRFFGGPKEYVISYTPPKDCTAPCVEADCPPPIVDCLVHTQALINKINEHTELRKFGVKAQLVNAPYVAGTANMTKYCMSICDNGDTLALNNVRAQYPTASITRTKREGAISTYEFCQRTTAPAPGPFAQTGSVLQAVCLTCPTGSVLVPTKDVYRIRRVVAATTDLTTPEAKDTFADSVGTAYNAAATDADKTFIGLDDGVAIIEVKVASGTAMPPQGSDEVSFAYTQPAECTFAAPASVAWATCGVGIASSRTMRINSLNRIDCTDGDRIADLQKILAGVIGIKIATLTKIAGVACVDDYTVEQDSVDCLAEDCLTNNVTFQYDDLPAVEGRSFEVVPVTVIDNAARKCGIRINAGYVDPKTGNCSFDIMNYYETMPVKMEISLLIESDEDNCDVKMWPTITQVQRGQMSKQSGEEILRELIIKDASYLKHLPVYDNNQLENSLSRNFSLEKVDRNAFYKIYYVTFRASYGKSFRKNEQERFTAKFAFKENDASAKIFEEKILSVLEGKSEQDAKFHIAQ